MRRDNTESQDTNLSVRVTEAVRMVARERVVGAVETDVSRHIQKVFGLEVRIWRIG